MSKNRAFTYWSFILIVALLSIVAFTGYLLYPRFDLPSVTGAGLLLIAVGAGVASFFAPCSFPLLVTLLSREVGANEEDGSRNRNRKAFTFATALSLGATAFLVLSGIILSLGGRALFANFTFASPQAITLRAVVGVSLILLGLIQAGVIHVKGFGKIGSLAKPLLKAQAKQRKENPKRAFFIYGFGYLVAGFG
ncbi:cytochrome c biogenesis CcdA family protein [Aquibacillus salsiterrae]|uniref:Cytochrome C biogenesis protein transmembrane domain-containing protein n=1 Tax=Aquibacillus salsiterrae TaxID=2950439 RepID=A0A9X3WF27_9BACI|nr:cytochrome c biogenesis protein CcdA [Aquibacillus salsiterrae]MDC3418637.1 hypothetical protein [Aquibacillus salsiterrae]